MAKKSSRTSRKREGSFPLWLHKGTGQWAKGIQGKRHYFGTDKQNALDEWLGVRDLLLSGRQASGTKTTRKTLLNPDLADLKTEEPAGENCRKHFANCKKPLIAWQRRQGSRCHWTCTARRIVTD